MCHASLFAVILTMFLPADFFGMISRSSSRGADMRPSQVAEAARRTGSTIILPSPRELELVRYTQVIYRLHVYTVLLLLPYGLELVRFTRVILPSPWELELVRYTQVMHRLHVYTVLLPSLQEM